MSKELKSIQINYTNYSAEDKKALGGFDPTKSDNTLTADDLTKLSPEQLQTTYQIFKNYRLDANGYSESAANKRNIAAYAKKNQKNPKDYVKAAAHSNQFLLFGESHESPKTRAFVATLPDTLKQEGFTHFAIEVDASKQGQIDEYLKTGNKKALAGNTWINDEFLAILDACKKAGLKVVCIDDHSVPGENRDMSDAKMFKNLKRLVLDDNPRAKIAIYIGRSHISESQKLNFVQGGHIVDTPTKEGFLGYLLEMYAPNKSHSIAIIDPLERPSDLVSHLRDIVKKHFALSVDSSPISTVVDMSFFNETFGGNYDGLILL